jgi:hypothetical protein
MSETTRNSLPRALGKIHAMAYDDSTGHQGGEDESAGHVGEEDGRP